MTEKHLLNCPECGGEVKRLIGTGSGPIFKGSGFYQTDYKNSSSKFENKGTVKSNSEPAAPKPEKKTVSKTTD
jgi:predicted nucleic acid-binding Zn ribbon protein